MCLSIPAKIIELDSNQAVVELAGSKLSVSTHLMEDLSIGDFVLIHSGFIIQKLSPEEAAETEQLLRDILTQEAD